MPEKREIIVLETSTKSAIAAPFTQGGFTGGEGRLSQVGALSGESLRDIIENYLHYYASGGSHTARAKRYDLQYFLEFLGETKNAHSVRVSDWTLQKTQTFIDYRLSLGESPATVARRLATIKHFGRTLAERIHGYINPAREVKGPIQQNTRPRGLSEEELQALKLAATEELSKHPESFKALRDKFLLELLLATGLRADEARLLLLGQVSEDYSWLKNVKTKGKKFRNVYLDSQIREELKHYCEKRAEELFKRYPILETLSLVEQSKFPLFIGFYRASPGTPNTFGLSPKTVWRTIATIGKHAQKIYSGPQTNLHPHLLRHTFAHGLLDSSKDVRLVAQALGHSDVRTTMRYTERGEEEIAKAIEKKVKRK